MRNAAYPFDWILSSPKFVYEMLELLLDKNMDVAELVKNHFLAIDKKATVTTIEHYISCATGFALYNSKYNAIFPHDKHSEETIAKYIRRFERLKNCILNDKEKLCLIYVSESSSQNGNFTIDGKNIITDVYFYLNKIHAIVSKYRKQNFKIVIFDAIAIDDETTLIKDIILYKLKSQTHWMSLVPDIQECFKKLLILIKS